MLYLNCVFLFCNDFVLVPKSKNLLYGYLILSVMQWGVFKCRIFIVVHDITREELGARFVNEVNFL